VSASQREKERLRARRAGRSNSGSGGPPGDRPPGAVVRRRRRWLLAAELLVVAAVAAVIVAIVLPGGGSPSHRAPATRPPSAATSSAGGASASSTAGGQTTPGGQPSPARPYAPNSVWNEPVPATVPLSPQSSAYVSQLQQQIRSHGEWINTTQYSIPVYTVGPGQAKVPVKLDQSGPGTVGQLAQAFAAGVPIPANARAAAGSDQSLVVYQPSTNTEWEFWQARKLNGEWHAYWGGKMSDVSGNPGYFDAPSDWGGSATSLGLLGGLMTIDELRSGHIDHALAMAIPASARGKFVYPAQRGDGHDASPNAIPEGTRFRLNPKLNLDSLHLPPMTRMIAEAAQRYGIIVRDQAGSVSLYGQDPTPTGTDPYVGSNGLFGGQSPDKLLQAFPWNQLQVVDPSWNHR
jgi:hypothetical protein